MTSDAGDDQYEIQRIVEGDPSVQSLYGPGPYVYWYLAQHVRPDAILFSGLQRSSESLYEARTGRIFLVTAESVMFLDYQNAIEEPSGDPRQEFGTATLTTHLLATCPVRSITWSDRSLNAKQIRIEQHAITVAAEGWSVELPYDRRQKDGDEYFHVFVRPSV